MYVHIGLRVPHHDRSPLGPKHMCKEFALGYEWPRCAGIQNAKIPSWQYYMIELAMLESVLDVSCNTKFTHSPRGLPAPPNPPLSSTWLKYGTLYYSSSKIRAAIPDTW